jgi:hypothetical protein
MKRLEANEPQLDRAKDMALPSEDAREQEGNIDSPKRLTGEL